MTTLKLGKRQKNGRNEPVIHVLMADGRVTEFQNRAVVIPEDPSGVVAVLMTPDGRPYYTPDGELAVLTVPFVGLDVLPDPDQWLSIASAAKRLDVSESTVDRLMEDGDLTKHKVGKRKVLLRQGEVDALPKPVRRRRRQPTRT